MSGIHEYLFSYEPLVYSDCSRVRSLGEDDISVLPNLMYVPEFTCFSDASLVPFRTFCQHNPLSRQPAEPAAGKKRPKTETDVDKDFVEKNKSNHPWYALVCHGRVMRLGARCECVYRFCTCPLVCAWWWNVECHVCKCACVCVCVRTGITVRGWYNHKA